MLLTVFATVSVSRSQTACDGPLNAGNPAEYLVEMAVAVDPTDNDRQAIAVTQPAAGNSQNPAPGDTKIRAWITFDGGRTWTESDVPTPGGSEYTGTIPYSDPTVVYDELGNLYVGYLLNRRDDNIQRQIIVAKAAAGTTVFTAYAASPWYDGTRKLDKPWMTVDESPASGTQGQLYVAYSTNDDNQIYFTKSTPAQRGTAWSSPVKITVPGKNGFFVDLATGVDGTVYAAWFCFCGGSVSEIIFSDLGPGANSPGSVVTLKQVNNDLPVSTTASPSRGVYPVPSIAVDRSNGAHQGRVWVAYSDFGTDPDRMDVYVQYWDGGLAPWSAPINLGRSDSSQFLPWITVDPLDGSVGLVYYSTAGDPTVAYASWTALDSGEGQMMYAQVHGPLSQIHSAATDEPSDRFGQAMTTGDFNGDGYDDVAIGAPYENDVAVDDGFVAIYYGSPDALTPPRWERIGQAGAGQTSETGDQFGSALAAGDFDHDGYDDLAVGIPGEDDVSADDGALLVYHGSAQGLVPVNAIYFDQTDFGLDSGLDDRFASVLTSGDFDGDSYDDLAIGVPGEDDVAVQDGNVIVQYGGPLGLGTADWERLRQSHGGMIGEDSDRFGDALAAGDFNGDGRDDLAVGLPDEDDAAADDGNVLVFLGSSRARGPLWCEPRGRRLQWRRSRRPGGRRSRRVPESAGRWRVDRLLRGGRWVAPSIHRVVVADDRWRDDGAGGSVRRGPDQRELRRGWVRRPSRGHPDRGRAREAMSSDPVTRAAPRRRPTSSAPCSSREISTRTASTIWSSRPIPRTSAARAMPAWCFRSPGDSTAYLRIRGGGFRGMPTATAASITTTVRRCFRPQAARISAEPTSTGTGPPMRAT
jgi:hypothetical protein